MARRPVTGPASLVAVAFAGLLVAGPAAAVPLGQEVGPGYEPVPGGFAETVRVPQDFPTVQQGVDAAMPGGMVLIDRGVYEESVTVTVPYVTIRGVDRNETIVDGGGERVTGIQVIEADGVTIQNLTVRNHTQNGVLWLGVHGYWGSYLTAHDNGERGILVDASDFGQLDHSWASGSAVAGVSVVACDPCHALITDVTAERNGVGIEGVNASDLSIVNSEWRSNGAGIVLGTSDSEPMSPQSDALVAGNHVHDNGAPSSEGPHPGNGIVIAGGSSNRIVGNLIEDHPSYGVIVLPSLDQNLWVTSGNRVIENEIGRSGLADLALGAGAAGADCFGDNSATSSAPAAIELLFPCEGFRPFPGGGGSLAPLVNMLTWQEVAEQGADRSAPPAEPQMPGDPAAAPPRPAIPDETVPQSYTIRALSEIEPVPGPEISKELTLMGMPLAKSWWSLMLGLYGYILPFVLYASWVAIAMWDLLRQESASIPHRARWMLIVMVVPFVGPLLYFAIGRSPIPRELRVMLTAGGALVYAVFLALGALLGG